MLLRVQNKMKVDKTQIRHNLLYEHQLGRTAAQTHRNICAAFKKRVPSKRTCQRWFKRFESGDFFTEDKLRQGRPVELDCDALVIFTRKKY